jgi:hypothetical protein
LNTVREFLQRAFNVSADAPFLNSAVMAWKYWDRRDDWDEPRAYVLERDGVIVAHAGIYPMTFSTSQVRGVHMIYWASAKESPGSGLALLQKLDTMFDFIYSIGGSEMTRKILPAFGFVECAKQWRCARPLRPLQQIATHQCRNWKLAPRLGRNYLWTLPKASLDSLHQDWRVEEIGPDEVSENFYSQDSANICFSPRSSAFFEYLLRCPMMQMHLYGIHDKRETKGHFAIGVLRGQARIAGVWLRDPDGKAWQAAFSLAQKAALRLEGAYEFVAAGTKGSSQQGATASGLRIIRDTPVYLLNKKGKLTLPPEFQFQLSDDDSLFLDSGTSSYLT